MPSFDARSDAGSPSPERVVAAAAFMAERGIYGVAWLDESLRAIERYGPLVSDVTIGAPLSESLVAFIGFEDEIRALRGQPGRSVAIPSVQMVGQGDQASRLNLVVYWMEREQLYLLLVALAVAPEDLEHGYLSERRLRRMAEAEVAAKSEIIRRANEELAIANRDLEEFAYVISHDLRSPLRGLRYATTDAQAALAAGDVEAARQHLVKVIERSRRMSAMLTGLLDYARIGRKVDAAAPLDTHALVQEIAQSSAEGMAVEVCIEGEWPTIVTIAEPLDIVLRNLVDNAVKHHDRESGRVVVSCRDEETCLAITVADDGPGIEPSWHAAVFEPFKQMADADEADGAGIGLALVKKTIERFGGSIRLTSNPATRRGTTFDLIWPKTVPEKAPANETHSKAGLPDALDGRTGAQGASA